MPIRLLVRFPDPLLQTPCRPVTEFDDDLRDLARDLVDTMRAAPGIGITAAHLGILTRLVVIELPGEAVRIYINPHIVHSSAENARHAEGSVSMPGVAEEVERPAQVTVGYRDLDGNDHEEEASGLLAVCLQHEIDQLDGIFWLRRLSRLKRERAIKRYGKAQQTGP